MRHEEGRFFDTVSGQQVEKRIRLRRALMCERNARAQFKPMTRRGVDQAQHVAEIASASGEAVVIGLHSVEREVQVLHAAVCQALHQRFDFIVVAEAQAEISEILERGRETAKSTVGEVLKGVEMPENDSEKGLP